MLKRLSPTNLVTGIFAVGAALLGGGSLLAAEGYETAVDRDYEAAGVIAPPAPQNQTQLEADEKSAGCNSCHVQTDAPTMHVSDAVVLGCIDCHGGNAEIYGDPTLGFEHEDYVAAREAAHVLPTYPDSWHYPSSANPERSYSLLNREDPIFIRFVNPSDYRVAREACGACHMPVIEAAERSLMATGAMLWGGAAYNNGILPYKNYVVGEAYTRDGEAAMILSPSDTEPGTVTPEEEERGALAALYPLPTWQVVPPADVFRVFERGGRTINTQFPEIGIPNPTGQIQRLEEPGRPDLRQSNRGPGTGLRAAIPVLNIHKTRLNDPFTWFMGTNDQPGDYRHSGCASCHVIYANDREPRHSLVYAQYGRDGQTVTSDPTIAAQINRLHDDHGDESHADEPSGHGDLIGPDDDHAEEDDGYGPDERERGHPLRHVFTRAIPTAQCMNCHMHQPNIFLNSYLGYTMWDYESDAPMMWPGPENTAPRPPGMSDEEYREMYLQQRYPTAEQVREVLDRNPEGAAPRGLWADLDFLRNVYDLNSELQDTQMADYHGHGWNFRGIFRRDREGNLLDADGEIIRPADESDTPEEAARHDDRWRQRFRRDGEEQFVEPGTNPGEAVHMMSIHAENGMQCADCHYAQDSHGNGLIYGEVANAIEIGCKDCHGTADAYPALRTSGPAAPPEGHDLTLLRNPDGRRRFEWTENANGSRTLIQRSIVDPNLEWEVSLVRDSVDPASPNFNALSARSKLMSADGAETGNFEFGPGVAVEDRAHGEQEMACFTCHLSWTTSCGGCHLPIEANWQSEVHRYDGETTRNFATYNPQVARDQMFQLGIHQSTKGNQIAPIRSTSALVLSSTNINRERIYIQQPPVSASGFSSQAFAPHFPHTVRLTETKQCSDCHLSEAEDNNAIMSQLLLLGTNYVNFVGMHAWTGLEGGFEAVRVTEWEEPQAVLGSYLHRYAYPDYYRYHVEDNGRELINWTRGEIFDEDLSGETRALEEFANVHEGTADRVGCLQMRGEYMFVAEGSGGFRVYDIASVANKGFSERIITAPFSPLGHDTHVSSENASCMALATNQPIAPHRNTAEMREMNQEQAFLPIYSYAVVTDAEEGLILVNVDTLADGELRNNRLDRLTFGTGADAWNPDGVLNGARHVHLAGEVAYITADRGLVVVDLADPSNPQLAAVRPITDARASTIQFRYLWVSDAEGVKLFDVTDLRNPVARPEGTIPLANAQRMYIARTYLYIAGKSEGLVIADVTRPLAPEIYRRETFGGTMNDVEDVIVGSTNASLFAYVADGVNGMKVVQLTSPSSQPNFYGFSPAPVPELIAFRRTPSPAISLSKGLDRDRAVDETGGQMAVFGRLGSRPFNRQEMENLFLTGAGIPWRVSDEADIEAWVPGAGPVAGRRRPGE
ncbi:multiheme c-type cytochrome [Aurantiacibacter sp. MUD61]|uniref:multiheme c-type cytochrome n=1 Tax=Aurantiacibacter sp. MUD61 TaxID=3009083 RepID=UPI0022F100AD|nr:multiheme c-type cytochrome [Aurantiacibacter sp. MUD61]